MVRKFVFDSTGKDYFSCSGVLGKTVIAPGVGESPESFLVTDDTDEIIKHKYYQWVFLVLLLQAFFFYLPRYIWKVWEGGRIRMIVESYGMLFSLKFRLVGVESLRGFRFECSVGRGGLRCSCEREYLEIYFE